jgi:2,3-bisphosphoglycerate-independent phosphoglycerate mutase
MADKKLALIILDGWGHGKKDDSDMVHQARTPFVDSLYESCPNAELRTDGENVGLPEGQMGNSEVGHINIGAGRIVHQELVRIDKAIEDGSLARDPKLREAFSYAEENGKKVHIMGLLSDGGVHSHQRHIQALTDIASEQGVKDLFVHAFTDGRDTDPHGARNYLSELLEHLEGNEAELASIVGRYYAMDRDHRWERIKKAYDLLVHGNGEATKDPLQALEASYRNGITDEFLEPIVRTDEQGEPFTRIEEGDVVISANFRTDRCRQITMALTQQAFPDQDMEPLDLHYITMTNYDDRFENVRILFPERDLPNTLGEVLSNAGRTQLRIAETEKYPHVTFFFNGGRESEFEGEDRIMVPSPKVATYDLQPEMSAREVTDRVIGEIQGKAPDFICLNFANPDMVGHTGVPEAIGKAVETVDACTKEVVEAGKEAGYSFLIIADHGNADYIKNEDGSPNTAHTKNPVPIFLIDEDHASIRDGILADVAPSVLRLMNVERPAEMSGDVLVEKVKEKAD